MPVDFINTLADIPAKEWNALLGAYPNPFVRHEFLLALEQSGCTRAETGWEPQHLILKDDSGALVAAAPMYLKTHSYGEYVFDWAWADACQRSGLAYYPKLVSAAPFSPVTGPRLMLRDPGDTDSIEALANGARELAQELRASSIHWLFPTQGEAGQLTELGYLPRTGFQYHWQNDDYPDFDAFLGAMSSAKRKKVKRERRQVREQGITMRVIEGDAITEEHWDTFFQFYRATIMAHGAWAYLNLPFFRQLGETMRDSIVLVFADKDGETIAGALNLKNDDTLFGRYWGSLGEYHSLHFETCYYTAIEYCITHGLKRFEAGAQGGHKLSRGFLPTPTWSAHWLAHEGLREAVADFLRYEQNGVEHQINELTERAPFKRCD